MKHTKNNLWNSSLLMANTHGLNVRTIEGLCCRILGRCGSIVSFVCLASIRALSELGRIRHGGHSAFLHGWLVEKPVLFRCQEIWHQRAHGSNVNLHHALLRDQVLMR